MQKLAHIEVKNIGEEFKNQSYSKNSKIYIVF